MHRKYPLDLPIVQPGFIAAMYKPFNRCVDLCNKRIVDREKNTKTERAIFIQLRDELRACIAAETCPPWLAGALSDWNAAAQQVILQTLCVDMDAAVEAWFEQPLQAAPPEPEWPEGIDPALSAPEDYDAHSS